MVKKDTTEKELYSVLQKPVVDYILKKTDVFEYETNAKTNILQRLAKFFDFNSEEFKRLCLVAYKRNSDHFLAYINKTDKTLLFDYLDIIFSFDVDPLSFYFMVSKNKKTKELIEFEYDDFFKFISIKYKTEIIKSLNNYFDINSQLAFIKYLLENNFDEYQDDIKIILFNVLKEKSPHYLFFDLINYFIKDKDDFKKITVILFEQLINYFINKSIESNIDINELESYFNNKTTNKSVENFIKASKKTASDKYFGKSYKDDPINYFEEFIKMIENSPYNKELFFTNVLFLLKEIIKK